MKNIIILLISVVFISQQSCTESKMKKLLDRNLEIITRSDSTYNNVVIYGDSIICLTIVDQKLRGVGGCRTLDTHMYNSLGYVYYLAESCICQDPRNDEIVETIPKGPPDYHYFKVPGKKRTGRYTKEAIIRINPLVSK